MQQFNNPTLSVSLSLHQQTPNCIMGRAGTTKLVFIDVYPFFFVGVHSTRTLLHLTLPVDKFKAYANYNRMEEGFFLLPLKMCFRKCLLASVEGVVKLAPTKKKKKQNPLSVYIRKGCTLLEIGLLYMWGCFGEIALSIPHYLVLRCHCAVVMQFIMGGLSSGNKNKKNFVS